LKEVSFCFLFLGNMSLKSSEYDSVTGANASGETPLLGSLVDNYDTTNISEDKDAEDENFDYFDAYRDSKDEEDTSDNILTDVSHSSSDRSIDVDEENDEIKQLVKQAAGMEKQVREKMSVMPPWMLKVCVVFFTLLAVIALVGGLLYVFDVVSAYQSIIQWITVFIAIFGNCLGSCAVFYSGSFKQEIESLAKGVKQLQAASDQLEEHIDDMMGNRKALARTKNVLDEEIQKIGDDVNTFEENEKIIVETADNIEKNAKMLTKENAKLMQAGKMFSREEEKLATAVRQMASNQENIETYNENVKGRVGKLTNVVDSLENTIPEFDEQLKRFNKLRENVEMVSTQMGGDVDNTTKTVNVIFNEIKELHIRQERIMLYQLLERVLATTPSVDEMDITGFHRFTCQMPQVYNRADFNDEWFDRAAFNGTVQRVDLKVLIDKITHSKIVKDEE